VEDNAKLERQLAQLRYLLEEDNAKLERQLAQHLQNLHNAKLEQQQQRYSYLTEQEIIIFY